MNLQSHDRLRRKMQINFEKPPELDHKGSKEFQLANSPLKEQPKQISNTIMESNQLTNSVNLPQRGVRKNLTVHNYINHEGEARITNYKQLMNGNCLKLQREKFKLKEEFDFASKKADSFKPEQKKCEQEIHKLEEILKEIRFTKDQKQSQDTMFSSKTQKIQNLKRINQEIIQAAKNDLDIEIQEKNCLEYSINEAKEQLKRLMNLLQKKEELKKQLEEIRNEKMYLEEEINKYKAIQIEKETKKEQKVRIGIQKLIEEKKMQIENSCNKRINLIREVAHENIEKKYLKEVLKVKAIPYNSYLSFSEMRVQPEFNPKNIQFTKSILKYFEEKLEIANLDDLSQQMESPELIKLKSENQAEDKRKNELDEIFAKKEKQLEFMQARRDKLEIKLKELEEKKELSAVMKQK